MFKRPVWLDRLSTAHRQASIAWLTGVRRVGKTSLVAALPDALYLNCDLPSTAARVADPELFLGSVRAPLLVLDEIHQLPDPSRLLKIAADAFPKLRVVATGSSTLAATSKFRDSLTGRKRTVHLVPVLAEELPDFSNPTLEHRLLHGGLPQALLADHPPSDFYAEWLDSFYARDVQELFRVEKRSAFLLLLETLLRNSSGLAEVTALSRTTGLSRPTVGAYLDALQVTHAIRVLRPYAQGGKRELTHQPKIYGFDTGFVAWVHGWNELHGPERGLLWEHLVLETLMSLPGEPQIQFWRDKQQHEIDFVLPAGRHTAHALECKWSADAFDPTGLRAFRASYPEGRNLLVAPISGSSHPRRFGDLIVEVVHVNELRSALRS